MIYEIFSVFITGLGFTILAIEMFASMGKVPPPTKNTLIRILIGAFFMIYGLAI